jgi:O-acetylserine/cysteine efflux transporter
MFRTAVPSPVTSLRRRGKARMVDESSPCPGGAPGRVTPAGSSSYDASGPGWDAATRMAGLRRPVVALVVAAGLWGAAVSGTKYALGGFDPVTLLSVELLAAAGVLWAALLVRGYRRPGSWWLPALLGLLEPALAYLGDTFGLSLTSAVHGAVISGLESGLVVLLAALLLRETATRPAILAIVVALGGLAVLASAGAGGGTAAGDLLVAGGVLSASLYTIVAKRFDDGSDALSLTAWQFAVATSASLLVTITHWTAGSGARAVSAAPRFWLVAVLVGVGGFGVSFLLFNMAIVQVDAGRTAVVLNLIPVFGVVSAVVFLREGMTSRDALGAVLVGSSVLYFAIADRRNAAAQAIRAEHDSARLSGHGGPVTEPTWRTGCREPDAERAHLLPGDVCRGGGPKVGEDPQGFPQGSLVCSVEQ